MEGYGSEEGVARPETRREYLERRIKEIEAERTLSCPLKSRHGNGNPWVREDAKRPMFISQEEAELRWELAFGARQ